MQITVPDWVPEFGGKTFGINIPNIPALAQGGIVSSPTLAMIGEGNEPEAVTPLSKLRQFMSGGAGSSGEDNYHFSPVINVNISGNATEQQIRETAQMTQREFDKMLKTSFNNWKRIGFSPSPSWG